MDFISLDSLKIFEEIEVSPLSKALREGNGTVAQDMINHILETEAEFTQEELWQVKVFKKINFTNEEFLSLSLHTQKLIYRTANSFYNIVLVNRLNSLEQDPEKKSICRPGIISCFMDVASVRREILSFLVNLRKRGELLTKKEMENLNSEHTWRVKQDFTRILGRQHLLDVIDQKKFKYIKVPEKKVVLEREHSTLSFKLTEYNPYSGLIDLGCEDVSIYAQEIQRKERFLCREEIVELFAAIKASNCVDLWNTNFIISDNGIYFIDTEFKSFSGSIEWDKMLRLECFISETDKQWFRELVQEQINIHQPLEWTPAFTAARFMLRLYNKEELKK